MGVSEASFRIEASSSDYDPLDDRFVDQVQGLLQDLQREAGEVRKEVTPVPGMKGGISEFVVLLKSIGAIGAAVDVIRAWLGRDRSRSLEIKVRKGDKSVSVRLSAVDMDEERLRKFMSDAFEGARRA